MRLAWHQEEPLNQEAQVEPALPMLQRVVLLSKALSLLDPQSARPWLLASMTVWPHAS
jgi:hypothetical protein